MNILILNWRDLAHPKSGGAEIVTMEHAKRWVKLGHHVTWFTADYESPVKSDQVDGVSMIRRGGTLSVYLFSWIYLIFYSRFFDVIVDEVHGFPFFTPLFTRKPVVVFIHEIAGEIWDFMFPFPKNIAGKFLENSYFHLYRNCFFWTDATSTISELVQRGIPRGQCVAIPCPIIIDTKALPKKMSKEKEPTFLFVSRVVRMKGIEEVIKAFSFIATVYPKAKLWIVGGTEDSYKAELIKMTHEYGVESQITFCGQVNEREKYERMMRAHMLLHASVKEGWGLVVLEAARFGTPAVVYNVNGLKDVVKNGRTGIVVANNSPREMAKEAIDLYKDTVRYKLYQRNGKEWVNGLKWSSVIEMSIRLLTKAVATKKR